MARDRGRRAEAVGQDEARERPERGGPEREVRHQVAAAPASVVPLVRKTASGSPHARSTRRNAAVGTGGTSSQRATPAGETPRRAQNARYGAFRSNWCAKMRSAHHAKSGGGAPRRVASSAAASSASSVIWARIAARNGP